MDFKENTDALFDAHRKTKRVISSCVIPSQLESARNYVENFRRWMSCIVCEDKTQEVLLKGIIDDVELELRLKYLNI